MKDMTNKKIAMNNFILILSLVLLVLGLIWPFTINSTNTVNDRKVVYMIPYITFFLPFFGAYNLSVAGTYLIDMPIQKRRIIVVSVFMILMPLYLIIFALIKQITLI